mgnify:FL=1
MISNTPPILKVAAKSVIVNNKGEVLIVRESAKNEEGTQIHKWGLIGGRLEPGEPFYTALQRETREEVGLKVEPIKPLYVGEWTPVIKGIPTQIIAVFILCKALTENVVLSDEHDDFAWILPASRTKYTFMPPDDKVVDLLLNV